MLQMEVVGPNQLILTASNSNNYMFGKMDLERWHYDLLALMFYTYKCAILIIFLFLLPEVLKLYNLFFQMEERLRKHI